MASNYSVEWIQFYVIFDKQIYILSAYGLPKCQNFIWKCLITNLL